MEFNNRISKASSAFGRLRRNVWERKGLSITTMIKIYCAVVLTTLLYASETWTVYKRHARKLNHFHLNCLRKILRIKWQDKIPDTEVLERAGLTSIYTLLLKSQARWAGHVSRMPDSRIPKQLFYGELHEGKRRVGGQKKRYKDNLKASLKELKIDTESWEASTTNCAKWRSKIFTGALAAETTRLAEAKHKRAVRKERSHSSTAAAAPTHECTICGRFFRARIGLISYSRTQK